MRSEPVRRLPAEVRQEGGRRAFDRRLEVARGLQFPRRVIGGGDNVHKTWAVTGGLLMLFAATTFSQSGRSTPPVTFVTAADVTKVLNAPNAAADNPIKIVDMGKYNISL